MPSGQPAGRWRYDELNSYADRTDRHHRARYCPGALSVSFVVPDRGRQPAVFLDGPGGTQVPQRVIDAISDYLKNSNANTHGAYATSQRTDAVIAGARAAMADFFGCDRG